VQGAQTSVTVCTLTCQLSVMPENCVWAVQFVLIYIWCRPCVHVCAPRRFVTMWHAVVQLDAVPEGAKPSTIRQDLRWLRQQVSRLQQAGMPVMPAPTGVAAQDGAAAAAGSSRPAPTGSNQGAHQQQHQQQGEEQQQQQGGSATQTGGAGQHRSPLSPQQQQQQQGGGVFYTPGGNAHTQGDLHAGWTPQVHTAVWCCCCCPMRPHAWHEVL
jgi:hypothetical protein